MPKLFVLDTNVLITDPNAIYKFQENDVAIPLAVLEELDKFKSEMSERGRASRIVARTLDKFRAEGSLFEGIPLTRPDESECGSLRVVRTKPDVVKNLPLDLDKSKADTIIVAAVLQLMVKNEDVVFVTQDVGLRVKCDSLKIVAEAYEGAKVTSNGQYKGWSVVDVDSADVDKFYASGELDTEENFPPNAYVMLQAYDKSALARYNEPKRQFVKLYQNSSGSAKGDPNLWGISPRNSGQRFALDALLDDSLHLVTLTGKAGSGKTLLALAAGLHMTADLEHYRRTLAARPIVVMGKDLGYLPGDIEEKLAPWMQPIYDNAELLLNSVDEDGKKKKGHQELIDLGVLEIEALTYVRGRSIPRQYFIVDEAQNLTPHEIKTIITRAGEGTKIVLTGDPDQIDNPLLDRSNNGLTYAIEKFKQHNIAAHVTLEKGERSELATLAAEIL